MKYLDKYGTYLVKEGLGPTDPTKMEKKESIFDTESGFDTPKKLNRSDKVVPKELLEEIEKGISSETLENIEFPVFKYKTQITIHGQFGELTKQRVGGYKWLFQNQNLSIGIKWNAIDHDKKKLIYSVMRKAGFYEEYNSSNHYASMMSIFNEENYNKLKKIYDKIDDSLFTGTKNLYKGSIPFYGTFLSLEVHLNAIKQKDIWTFLEKSFGISEADWDVMEEERKEKERLREEEYRKQREVSDAEEKEKLLKTIEETKAKYPVVTFDTIPPENCIMLYFKQSFMGGEEVLIKKYTDKSGKDKYQWMRVSYNKDASKDEINTRLTKYDQPADKIKKVMEGKTIFLIKKFDGTGRAKTAPVVSKPKFTPTATPAITSTSTPAITPTSLELIDYSDKAVALFGDSRAIKDQLKHLGGRYNPFLVNPKTNQKQAGWIFPKTKKIAVEDLIK